MPTAFKEHSDNALATIATANGLNNVTTPIVISLAAGKGALFATIANGQYVTIWDKTAYPDPFDDPQMELALITARTADSITLTRASAKTHAGSPFVAELSRSLHFQDIETAINTAEGTLASTTITANAAGKASFDAVVALSGGDYTTIGAALTAGKSRIRLMPGTYTETTDILNTYTLTTKDLYIEGIDRTNTILQISSTGANYFRIKYPTIIKNITIYVPGSSTGNTSANGAWIRIYQNLTVDSCFFKGNNVAATSSPFFGMANPYNFKMINCEETLVHAGGLLLSSLASNYNITGCKFIATAGAASYGVKFYFNNIGISLINFNNNFFYFSNSYDGGTQVIRVSQDSGIFNFNNNYFGPSKQQLIKIDSILAGAKININNNYFETTQGSNLGNDAIVIDNSSSNVAMSGVFSGNIFKYGNANVNYKAVKMIKPKNMVISNNSIFAASGIGNQAGIYLDSPDRCTITGNVTTGFYGTASYGIQIIGTGTNVFAGNHGGGNTADFVNATTTVFPISGTIYGDTSIAAPTPGTYVLPTGFYGTATTNALLEPSAWIPINIVGVDYKIPIYE